MDMQVHSHGAHCNPDSRWRDDKNRLTTTKAYFDADKPKSNHATETDSELSAAD